MKPIGKIILPAVVATAATPGHAARAIAGSLALLVAFCGETRCSRPHRLYPWSLTIFSMSKSAKYSSGTRMAPIRSP